MSDLRIYVLDAWAVLAYLQAEEPAAGRVRQLLQAAQEQSISLFISMINLGEVYYRIGKLRGPVEADLTLRELRQLPWAVIPANDENVLAAARLKMQQVLSYADAFAAAAALDLNAILLTGDPELIQMQGVIQIETLGRNPQNKML